MVKMEVTTEDIADGRTTDPKDAGHPIITKLYEPVQVGMCAHTRVRSACASAQSDQSLLDRCSMGSQGFNVSSDGILRLIRLCGCEA